jgi:hypothetical protein
VRCHVWTQCFRQNAFNARVFARNSLRLSPIPCPSPRSSQCSSDLRKSASGASRGQAEYVV